MIWGFGCAIGTASGAQTTADTNQHQPPNCVSDEDTDNERCTKESDPGDNVAFCRVFVEAAQSQEKSRHPEDEKDTDKF
jgi:hypothetical protein